MSNSQKPSDKELLATLVKKNGAEPREAKFDVARYTLHV